MTRTCRKPRETAFLAAALALLAGCGAGTEAPPGAGAQAKGPLVSVAPVRLAAISRTLALTGEAVPVLSATVAATVEGRIAFCPWREGDRVESAGTLLVEIDRELFRAEVKAASAALGVAKARLEDLKAGTRPEEIEKAREAVRQVEQGAAFAAADVERVEKLAATGALPGEALEKARVENASQQARLAAARKHLEMLEAGFTKTAVAVQEALVKEAEAREELAKARLAECRVAAPFPGTVTRVHVRPGDLASLKAPLLELADLSTVVLRVAVPEAQAAGVREGAPARVELDALPRRSFEAKVVRLYPELDVRMRTRTAELVLADPSGLMPGMFARVSLILETAKDALVIPREAIVERPGGMVVFVVENDKAVQRKVALGIEEAGRVQVTAGLAAGEPVVIRGGQNLKDGADVRVTKGGEGQSRGAGAGEGPSGKAESAPPGAGKGGGR